MFINHDLFLFESSNALRVESLVSESRGVKFFNKYLFVFRPVCCSGLQFIDQEKFE